MDKTTIIVTIVVAVLGSPFFFAFFEWIKDKTLAWLRYHRWQAVFLANGQVYFGKITSVNRNEITLKNIYYLQKNESQKKFFKTPFSDNVKLIKLGGEIHGPDDMMIISKLQILFTENLRADSTVVKQIQKNK